MTELIITPNYDKKTARFKGTIAGGESVKVTIVGAANWLSDGLRLRVVCGCNKTVAMFPLKSEEGSVDSFKVEGDDLIAAPLELNTIQARLHTQGLAAITATFIVEDVKNNILYFQDSYELHGWIKRCGDDEPYDLTKFPGLIDAWTEQIDNMEVSAKRVDNGVEIVAWDGKGEMPAAVMLRDGAKGDQGNPLTWGDLTDEQKASLKGEPFTWDDLTDEQKLALKGDKGDKGDKGNPLTWSDLTDEQKASLKGEPFTWDDLTDEQKLALKGDKGDCLKWEDLTEEQKHSLKGDKGDTAAHDLVPCDEDGEFYRLVAVKNENGEMVLALEQEKSGIEPNTQAVLTTTDQTIDGVKTFAQKIKGTIEKADTATKATQDGNGKVISDTYLPLNGSKPMTSGIRVGSSNLAWRTVDDGVLAILGGSGNDKGAKLVLVGKDHSDKGLVYLESNDGTTYVRFLVRPDGRVYTYNKDGKMTYFAKTVNNIAADSNGNVTLPLNFLPLAGGTMTGEIVFNDDDTYIKKKDNATYLALAGGNGYDGGAILVLYGKDKDGSSGAAYIRVCDKDGNAKSLQLNPTGLLTWNGKNIVRSVNGTTADAEGNIALPLDFLPKSGGAVSGPIKGTALSNSGKSLLLFTGENNFDGASIQMFEKAHPLYEGKFYIRASTKSSSSDTSGSSCDLVGSPDGSLTWGTNPVAINNKAMTTTGLTLKGTVTAATQSGVVELGMQSDADTKAIRVSGGTGWSNGGSVVVYGKNHTDAPGRFRIKASDGTTQAILEGKPNGTLQWGGKNIVRSIRGLTADVEGDVWLEFLKLMTSSYSTDAQGPMLSIGDPSGLAFVMQSGVIEEFENGDATVTFDAPFLDTDYVVICQPLGSSSGARVVVTERTTTTFTVTTYSASAGVMWFAFGYPKN